MSAAPLSADTGILATRSEGAVQRAHGAPKVWTALETVGAWLLALLWLAPLVYALWASLHTREYATTFSPTAPVTLDNFSTVLDSAPFARYYANTVVLVVGILAAQLVLAILAAYAFARLRFWGREFFFALVLIQLMVVPEVLISENYTTMARLRLVDTIAAIGLPYAASAIAIFLLRQTFKSVPKELDEAAEMEGCGHLQLLWRVYVPLSRPTLVAFGLVSVSYHWNNFLWPIVVTNSVESRPLTVGLAIFNSTESGVEWTLLSTATVLIVLPLLVAFLIFQRQFVQSFMRAGIR